MHNLLTENRKPKTENRINRWWEFLKGEVLAGTVGLGVYLDRAGITLVRVQKGLTGIELKEVVTLPRPEEGLAALLPQLREIITQGGLDHLPVGLAVSRELGFIKEIVLPQAALENLGQVVAYELDRFLPLGPEGLYYDFQVLGQTDREVRLLLLGLTRQPVAACLELLREVGLKPLCLKPAPVAAANAFALLGGPMPAAWLLLARRPGFLELSRVQGRTLRGFQSIPLTAGTDPTLALAAAIAGLADKGETPAALALYGQGPPDLAALAGMGDFELITPERFRLKGLPAENPPEAAALPALGAALRALVKAPLAINLLPPEERVRVRFSGSNLLKLLLALCLTLAILWAGSLMVHRRVALYRVDRQLAQLAPEARQEEALLEESRAMAKQLDGFRQRLGDSPNKLLALKELTQLIPDHTWLFHLRVSGPHLEMSGVSRSAADLIPLLERSGWLKKTEFASPITTDASKLEHFKIKAEIKGLEVGS